MRKISGSKYLDTVFVALTHIHRRKMMCALGLQPYSISQLASQRHLSLPAIYKHIKILENARLIHRNKTGQTTYLSLNWGSLQILQDWLKQFHTYWGKDNESLANYHQYLKGGEK